MPSLGAEVPAVQLPMLRYAQDIGWKLVAQAEALKRRGGETGRLMTGQVRVKDELSIP